MIDREIEQQTQESQMNSVPSAAELQLLHDVSNQIIQTRDLDQTLKSIVSGAMKLMNAQSGVIYLVDPDNFKVVQTYKGSEAHYPPRMENPNGITRNVIANRQPVNIPDIDADTRVNPALKGKYKSMIAAPLMLKERVIGVLYLNTTRQHNFSEAEIFSLCTLTVQAAIAVDNSSLFEAEHKERALAEALIDSSPIAIIAIDPKGKITKFNKASERVTGYCANEIDGKSFEDLFFGGPRDVQRFDQPLNNLEATNERAQDVQASIKSKTGEPVPVRLTGTLVKSESGERIANLYLMTDLREVEIQDRAYKVQQDFLAEIEHYPQYEPINSRGDLQRRLTHLLKRTREFFNLEYIILFASRNEKETVLPAVAWEGLHETVEHSLPHFNWRKAGLQKGFASDGGSDREAEFIAKWIPDSEWRRIIVAGIRGENQCFFKDLACGVPVRLADNFRAVVVFGPFENRQDLYNMSVFIQSVAQGIAINALSWLQTLYLRAQHTGSRVAAQLVVHRGRTHLSGIIGQFGLIKKLVPRNSPAMTEAESGEHLAKTLSNVVERALTKGAAEMEPTDFDFQEQPLSVLVQNCVNNFVGLAADKNCEIRVDNSIERLPFAEVDSALLSVALGNLIENAIKYSFENSYILVRSVSIDGKDAVDTDHALISVQDFGEQLTESARRNLVEPGRRWAMSARARRIPGTGYGLWEASAIVGAHGGTLDLSSIEYLPHHGRPGHLVRVWMTLPLRQKRG